MSQFIERYYPTLCVRRAEMKAIEKLPLSEKVKMLPIVLLAPWLNSIKFENTFKIIEKSIGSIPIIVDIDRNFESVSQLPSRTYFRSLLKKDTGPNEWMNLVEDHPNYIPCIQIVGVNKDQIESQVTRAINLGRGFAYRIEINRELSIDMIFESIEKNIENDVIVIFDFGYSDDAKESRKLVSTYIERLISISNDAKFVVTGSNFPNDFSSFDDFSEARPIGSRSVYSSLRNKYDNYKMFYGDWASTKPRRYDGGGNRPLPRIDFPTKSQWIIARSKEQEWDFQQAAERIIRLPEWQERPTIWGTGMIEKTARGLPGGISTGPQAIASRINIHLYLQNNFSSTNPPPPPRSKWINSI